MYKLNTVPIIRWWFHLFTGQAVYGLPSIPFPDTRDVFDSHLGRFMSRLSYSIHSLSLISLSSTFAISILSYMHPGSQLESMFFMYQHIVYYCYFCSTGNRCTFSNKRVYQLQNCLRVSDSYQDVTAQQSGPSQPGRAL